MNQHCHLRSWLVSALYRKVLINHLISITQLYFYYLGLYISKNSCLACATNATIDSLVLFNITAKYMEKFRWSKISGR